MWLWKLIDDMKRPATYLKRRALGYLCVILLFSASFDGGLRAEGLRYFGTNPYEALPEARKQKKMLLVEFYADWNYRSRWMNEKVLSDSTLIPFIEEYFLAIQVDTGTEEGGRMATLYEVTGYPAIVIFNSNGVVLDKIDTTLDQEDFKNRIDALILVTQSGGATRLLNRIYAAAEGADRNMADLYAADFLASQTEQQVINAVIWPMFKNTMITFYYSSAFDYLLNHLEQFRKEIGEDEVNETVSLALLNAMLPYLIGTSPYSEKILHDVVGIADEHELQVASVLHLMDEMARLRLEQNWSAYISRLALLLNYVPESMQFPLILSLEPLTEEESKDDRDAAYRLVSKAISSGQSTHVALLESLRERLK